MGVHHTKDKGDLGTAKAHADLVEHGFMVLFPATEHSEFDLVAYRDGSFHRVQVKYRSAHTGSVSVSFRSVWADRNGTHMKPSDKSQMDVLCIYCPETDECYYLRPEVHGHSVTLRITPPRNGQGRGVHLASSFRGFPTPAQDTHGDTPRSFPGPNASSRQDVVRPRHV